VTDDEKEQRFRAVLRRHVDELMAEFDCVQIFVLKDNDRENGTEAMELGDGNFYARQAFVSEWLTRQDERIRLHERRIDERDHESSE
jgi:hypothetical protein